MKRKSALSALGARRSPRRDSEVESDTALSSPADAVAEIEHMEIEESDTNVKVGKFTETDSNTIRAGKTTYHGLVVGESVVFKGSFTIRVQKGAIRVLGAMIHANDVPYTISSYATHSLPVIECVQVENVDLVEEACEGTNEALFNGDYRAVIRLDPVDSGILSIGNIAPPFRSVFKLDDAAANGSYERLSSAPASTLLFSPFGSWINAAAHISTSLRSERQPVVMVIGAKSSGKSSFCKFLTNYLLSHQDCQALHYLELDPGQPEFVAPGTLSLSALTSFNLEPAYMHHPSRKVSGSSVVKAHSINSTSPKDQPSLYLSYARDLFQSYENTLTAAQTPLIINTPGWARGLGLDLTLDIAQSTAHPTHVIYLGRDEDSNSIMIPDAQIIPVEHMLGQLDPNPRVSAADLRTLHTLCYLHSHNFTRHLTHIPPYSVPYPAAISGVAMHQGEGIDIIDLKNCINGTLVSVLARQDDEPLELDVDDIGLPWIRSTAQVLSPDHTQCLGYAAVQSIDSNSQAIRLLAPEHVVSQCMNRSVVLARGSLQLPVWALWDAKRDELGPYLSLAKAVGAGSAPAKIRKNIVRPSHRA